MERFDRPRIIFYGFAIVTIALSCTVFELGYLTLNNTVTLKSALEVSQDHWSLCHFKACMRFPIRLL